MRAQKLVALSFRSRFLSSVLSPVALSLGLFFSLQTVAPFAQAYLSIGESAEVAPPGKNDFGLEPQLITTHETGLNIGAFVDMSWREDMSSRFNIGAGKTGTHLGTSLKYVPFPDVERQPAIGIKVAAWYARPNDVNVWTYQLAPLFSKKIPVEMGVLVPYVSVPFNFETLAGNSVTGTQFVVGSELHHKEVADMYFSAEIAMNLKDSYSFVSGTVAFPFDTDKGFQFRGR